MASANTRMTLRLQQAQRQASTTALSTAELNQIKLANLGLLVGDFLTTDPGTAEVYRRCVAYSRSNPFTQIVVKLVPDGVGVEVGHVTFIF